MRCLLRREYTRPAPQDRSPAAVLRGSPGFTVRKPSWSFGFQTMDISLLL